MDKSFSNILYDRLPRVYKKYDESQSEPYLKQFLLILGASLDEQKAEIDDFINLFDIDSVPAIFLPYLGHMLKVDFPYGTTEYEMRSFLKELPMLRKLKGTASVFKHLAREFLGDDAIVTVEKGTGSYRDTIILNIDVSSDIASVQAKLAKFNHFAEMFRPVNMRLSPAILEYYLEVFTRNFSESINDVLEITVDDLRTKVFSYNYTDSLIATLLEDELYKNITYMDEDIVLNSVFFELNNNFTLNAPVVFQDIIIYR